MPNAEWEKVKEALRKPATPEARKEAADAFRRYSVSKGKGSRPTLVSIGYKKPYTTSIELKDMFHHL
ncbi:hypothetical protein ES703_104139 [subsurface metagenome]